MERTPGFWTTLPGILTGIAAVLTALAGAYSVVRDDLPWFADEQQVAPSPHPGDASAQGAADDGNGDRSGGAATGIPVPVEHTAQQSLATGTTELEPLVDCTLKPYGLNNSLRSLMSWSDHYQAQIVAATGPGGELTYACQQALSYRGSAHCQAPRDTAIRQALFETLSLCRDKGVATDRVFGS